MRSMTGYGRGEIDCNGIKFSVELNSVNRKQSDIVVNLPRDLAGGRQTGVGRRGVRSADIRRLLEDRRLEPVA